MPAPPVRPEPTEAPGRLPAPARELVARIGDTPMLTLPSPAAGVRILGKAEWFNPGGSVKDRTAWGIVAWGYREGRLPERRLLDASSGNTAIAYAMLGAAAGFDVTLCVPENASRERLRTLRAYGAELVLTDALEGSDGAIRRARELGREESRRFWYADQYGNPENPGIHYRTTAPEIWRDTGGRITHLVVGLGTTGTAVGTGRRLHELNPAVRVIAVEPDRPFHGIEGLKHLESARVPDVFDASVPDERAGVSTETSQEGARRLARDAGLFVGVSSGGAYMVARDLAARLAADTGVSSGRAGAAVEPGREEAPGATVVVVLPDGGSRYLSEPWWEEGRDTSDAGGG